MDHPHCNNSNNIIGPQTYSCLTQYPDKYGQNGMTEHGFCPSDQGYNSCWSGDLEQNNSISIPHRTPSNGPHCHEHQYPGAVVQMQNRLLNGHAIADVGQSYAPQRGPMKSSYSAEAIEKSQKTSSLQNGWRGAHSLDDRQSGTGMQNGYSNEPSSLMGYPHGNHGYIHSPHSGEAVCQDQRPLQTFTAPLSTPNQKDFYHKPTSPRPPPVIRKHSSFTRQNAIEEEDNDDHDNLNDSGIGSLWRSTSRESSFRRSRSKDVSDAPADEVNNNLTPRKLQRSQSSQERTDNELAKFHCEQRRCSSEQLQRSNSSGYYTANSIQGNATEAVKSETGTAETLEDDTGISIIRGWRDSLDACKKTVWDPKELHQEILSRPDAQIASEVHKDLMRQFSLEVLRDRHINEPTSHSRTSTSSNIRQRETASQEIRSTRSGVLLGEFDRPNIPDTSSEIMISPKGSDKAGDVLHGNNPTADAPRQAPVKDTSQHPGDTFDEKTKKGLPELLERRAYCSAMKHNTCYDPECLKAKVFEDKFQECYRWSTLGDCQDCRESAKAYWKHSKGCHSDRCIVPFCSYFKELFSDWDEEMNIPEAALGCLMKQKEMDVLAKLHEFEQLQQPVKDDEVVWVSTNTNAERYLRNGELDHDLTTNGRLSKFGRFTPIHCEAQKRQMQASVVIKKIRCSRDLVMALKKLHPESSNCEEDDMTNTDPLLQDLIATCLWCKQIGSERMLVCSTYLAEKSFNLESTQDSIENYWKKACKVAVKLHEAGILYLNWKVDHILVTLEGQLKLCNLDYAVDISSSSQQMRGAQSEEWRGTVVPEHVRARLDPRIAPPEVFDGRGLCRESDSWGLGCLLYQLYHGGCLPFPHLSHLNDDAVKKQRLTDGHVRQTSHKNAHHKLLTDMCFNHDPMRRKLPANLVEEFDKYQKIWEAIGAGQIPQVN